ncbi:MAG: hypothetical protein V1859_07940 [archaeon]
MVEYWAIVHANDKKLYYKLNPSGKNITASPNLNAHIPKMFHTLDQAVQVETGQYSLEGLFSHVISEHQDKLSHDDISYVVFNCKYEGQSSDFDGQYNTETHTTSADVKASALSESTIEFYTNKKNDAFQQLMSIPPKPKTAWQRFADGYIRVVGAVPGGKLYLQYAAKARHALDSLAAYLRNK